jgi:5-methylcytosine-specific restriction endonuclease McrA
MPKYSTISYNVPDGYKLCSRRDLCVNPNGPVLPADTTHFYWRNNKLSSECRICGRNYAREYHKKNPDYSRQYRAANRDKVRAQKRAYYHRQIELDPIGTRAKRKVYDDARRELLREKARRYYKEHREEIAVKSKEYRKRKSEEIRARNKRYRNARPDKNAEWQRRYHLKNARYYRAYRVNRRAKELGAEGDHTPEDIDRIYEKQGGRCLYCGTDLNGSFHVDHFIPIVRGGRNSPPNLALACPHCNHTKCGVLPFDWQDWNGAVPVFWDWKLL